jgi:hypothetical protein
MDLYSTAKDLLKRVYDKGVTLTQPGGALSFQYPKDYVNPDRYDTPLDNLEKEAFSQWVRLKSRAKNKNMMLDQYDYDIQGYWKENVGLKPSGKQWSDSMTAKGHGTDRYKKPNHPTFSTESKYHGKDGYQGGVWGEGTFTPSEEMKTRMSKQQTQEYFKTREPGVKLVW